MGDVLDVVLPWLSGPLQWAVAALIVAVVISSWVAVFSAVTDEALSLVPAVVVSTLSVALGVAALILGRWIILQMGPMLASEEAGAVPAAFFLLVGEVLVGVFLMMGLALQLALRTLYLCSGDTTKAFRVIVAVGLVLWIAHEIVLLVHVSHAAG